MVRFTFTLIVGVFCGCFVLRKYNPPLFTILGRLGRVQQKWTTNGNSRLVAIFIGFTMFSTTSIILDAAISWSALWWMIDDIQRCTIRKGLYFHEIDTPLCECLVGLERPPRPELFQWLEGSYWSGTLKISSMIRLIRAPEDWWKLRRTEAAISTKVIQGSQWIEQ